MVSARAGSHGSVPSTRVRGTITDSAQQPVPDLHVNVRRSSWDEPLVAQRIVTLLYRGAARTAPPDTLVVDAVISDES